jgi:hypothetical protein
MIFRANPRKHVDVGSLLTGFVAHVASFRPIEVIDIRPNFTAARNIHFLKYDMMWTDFPLINYCDSLSCLHALEHFGLGRYGDPIDIIGHLKGWKNLWTMLEPGGKLYFSVPIGKKRIEFNGHRIFPVSYLLEMIKGLYIINSFSYVDDRGALHLNQSLESPQVNNNFGCNQGCGIFELTKLH